MVTDATRRAAGVWKKVSSRESDKRIGAPRAAPVRVVNPMAPAQAFCPRCGFQNTESKNFCSRCGNMLRTTQSFAATPRKAVAEKHPTPGPAAGPVPGKCGYCGHVNAPDAEFCQSCSSPLSPLLTIEQQDDVVYLKLNMPELDFETHRVLSPAFKAILRKKIIVDVSSVKFMDSTGIGTLVSQVYRFTRTKQEMKIVGMNRRIFEAVKQLQVDNVLELCDTVNDARAAWGLPPS